MDTPKKCSRCFEELKELGGTATGNYKNAPTDYLCKKCWLEFAMWMRAFFMGG